MLCRPFADVLAEYGTPYYLKIDIEGADHYCLEAIDPTDPPRYVSFEKNRLEDLFLAGDRGYLRFKLIAQENFRQLIFRPNDRLRYGGLSSQLQRWGGRLAYRLRLANHSSRVSRDRASDGWTFPYGSSGPFGDEADGPWRTLEEVGFSWLAYDLGYTGVKDVKWNDWFDIHCAL